MAKLSDVTSPQVQIESLAGHLQVDGDMVEAHIEMACQAAEEIQDPLDAVQPEYTQRVNSSRSLSPLVTLHDLRPVAP